jgi:transcriptional regulator with XRE-family HTH domain
MSEARQRPLGPAGNNVRRNIRRHRERRGWSYKELSERLTQVGRGIHIVDLGWVETGERRVDVDDLVALAAALEVGVEDLLQPPADCDTCHGAPPPGFMCLECETSGLPTR